MANLNDVVAYVVELLGETPPFRLHRLLYLSQGWSLAWEEVPLFDSRIEAWANGPAIPELYERHKGQTTIFEWAGDSAALSEDERDTIYSVVEDFKEYELFDLEQLCRDEVYRAARIGLDMAERGNQEISLIALKRYFTRLAQADPDLDQKVAELVMGWKRRQRGDAKKEWVEWVSEESPEKSYREGDILWSFDINAAFEMEEKLISMSSEIQEKYARYLTEIAEEDSLSPEWDRPPAALLIAHASPAQRCEAAVLAIMPEDLDDEPWKRPIAGRGR